MAVAVIIPAYNEAATVAQVAAVARQARGVDRVIVVDDGSADRTAEAAASVPGVQVIRLERNQGKGEAMRAGAAAAADAEILVFLDADLTGLKPEHVERLIEPVRRGEAVMACGLFDRGPWLNWWFLHVFPVLTGERALRRELFDALEPDELHGYKVEAALNSLCRLNRFPVRYFVLDGMFHVVKERKRGPLLGLLGKIAMLTVAAWSYVYFHLKRFPRYAWQRIRSAFGSARAYRHVVLPRHRAEANLASDGNQDRSGYATVNKEPAAKTERTSV